MYIHVHVYVLYNLLFCSFSCNVPTCIGSSLLFPLLVLSSPGTPGVGKEGRGCWRVETSLKVLEGVERRGQKQILQENGSSSSK